MKYAQTNAAATTTPEALSSQMGSTTSGWDVGAGGWGFAADFGRVRGAMGSCARLALLRWDLRWNERCLDGAVGSVMQCW